MLRSTAPRLALKVPPQRCSRRGLSARDWRGFSGESSSRSGGGSGNSGSPSSSSSTPASPPLPATTDLLEAYRGLVSQGRLQWDDEQVRCVLKLRHVLDTLKQYEPPLDLVAKLGTVPPRRGAVHISGTSGSNEGGWWWSGFGKSKGKGKSVDDGESESERERSLVRVLSGEEEIANLTTPKGILLTGPPGTGKSLLLSLFFSLVPTVHKRRHHYHAFTLSLYQKVFDEMERRRLAAPPFENVKNMQVASRKGWRAVFAAGRWADDEEPVNDVLQPAADPRETIPFIIAKEMILEYHVLYFDELQLLDASSAALLRDVLSWYWRMGGVIVSCSNRVPDDLYHHGVQRDRMAGFLDALKARCQVVELDGGRDWRRGKEESEVGYERAQRWFEIGDERFDAAWQQAGEGDVPTVPVDLSVYGRIVRVPLVKGIECRVSFADLCEQPLGPADYLTLASTFSTFFIDDIPVLLLKHKNEARRMINLIDALYESRCQVVARAAARPEHLFFPDALDSAPSNEDAGDDALMAEALSESLAAQPRPNVSLYNHKTRVQREREDRADRGSCFAVMSIFTGEDERFAYKRAVSRLVEMTTSPTYATEEWNPLARTSRQWEGPPVSAATPISPLVRCASSLPDAVAGTQDDLAIETGSVQVGADARDGDGTGVTPGPRESAPVFGEHHAWGVQDKWGKKAGRWGQGARVYEEKKERD